MLTHTGQDLQAFFKNGFTFKPNSFLITFPRSLEKEDFRLEIPPPEDCFVGVLVVEATKDVGGLTEFETATFE